MKASSFPRNFHQRIRFSLASFCSLFSLLAVFSLAGFSLPAVFVVTRGFFAAFCPLFFRRPFRWWAQVDSNHRPHDYQSCALTS